MTRTRQGAITTGRGDTGTHKGHPDTGTRAPPLTAGVGNVPTIQRALAAHLRGSYT